MVIDLYLKLIVLLLEVLEVGGLDVSNLIFKFVGDI
jgi:hypothetical protein